MLLETFFTTQEVGCFSGVIGMIRGVILAKVGWGGFIYVESTYIFIFLPSHSSRGGMLLPLDALEILKLNNQLSHP